MDQTQRLDSGDEEDEIAAERHRPVGNLHMFLGIYGSAQDFPIYPGPNVIGRHVSCDIVLPAQSVSKKHAILDVTGDCHTICDNGSLNKTRRNKTALSPYVRCTLSEGDFLQFADVNCCYTIVKKTELEASTAEDSEDDSMLVPGTQATLAIEKTPAAAIRRMGRGAVLAKDSGDEDEEEQRKCSDGDEGGSKDALSSPGPSVFLSPTGDTVVPESDEEIDTSTSETHFPFIPSSLNVSTSPSIKEPTKEEGNSLLHINKEEQVVKDQACEEINKELAGKEDFSESGLLKKERKKEDDRENIRLPCGDEKVVKSNSLDSGLKDAENNANNHTIDHENTNNLKVDADIIVPPEVSSTSNNCLKQVEDVVATTSIDINSDSHIQATEDNLNPTDVGLKIKADFCLDSDTDVDEDFPTTSTMDVQNKDDPETKSNAKPEQSNITLETGVHMSRDDNEDIDSNTCVKKDAEVSKSEDVKIDPKEGDISGTSVSACFDIDSDTDVDDADVTRSDDNVVQDSEKSVDEKKGHLEGDGNVSSTKLKMGEHDCIAADITLIETKDGIHLDSDTDVEEDNNVSSTDVAEGKQPSNVGVEKGFHMDSDTDDEDLDVSSTMVTKEKQTASINVQDAKEGLPLDSDTDVDEEDQRPGPSSAAVQSHINNQPVKTLTKEKDAVGMINKDDVDDGNSNEQAKAITQKNEAETVDEGTDLHIDSDTDVDEDGASLGVIKAEIPLGDGVSKGADRNFSGSSLEGSDGRAEVPAADSSFDAVESSEDETQQVVCQGADYDLMPTQCYLEQQEPESDLPDEEDATQAYLLSSTWAEPDPFKRPSDPVGVLQISAVTLDKSEEDVDEAETQLFCLQADQSPGPAIKETPKLEEEIEDNQQETQPTCSVEGSGKQVQEPHQGGISQEDTEPVSQCSPTETPVDTGTWIHLKRDVPASVWMKGLQKTEASDVSDDFTQDDLPPLELEATQSYISEASNIKEHIHGTSLLSDEEDHNTKHSESEVSENETPLKDLNSPEADMFSVTSKTPSLGPSITEIGPLAMPSTESAPPGPNIPEINVLIVPLTESTPSIPITGVVTAPTNDIQPSASSISETCASEVPLTDDAPAGPNDLDVLGVPVTESQPKELNMETQAIDDDATQVSSSIYLPVSNINVSQSNQEVPATEDSNQPSGSTVEDTGDKEPQSISVTMFAVEDEKTQLTGTEKQKPSLKRGLSRSRKKEQPESTKITTEKAQLPEHTAVASHSGAEETTELGTEEAEPFRPGVVVSATREEIVPDKAVRRGGRRKANETESKTKTKEESLIPAASRRRTSRTALEDEQTSDVIEAKRKQPGKRNVVKMKEEEEKQDAATEDLSSVEMNVDQKIDISTPSLESIGSGDKICSESANNTKRVQDLSEQSSTVSAPQDKRPVRGKRRAITKSEQDNKKETESNNIENITETETSESCLKKHDEFKIPTPKTSDSQDAGQDGPRSKRTRRSYVSNTESVGQEKPKDADIKASQNVEANKTDQDDKNSGNTRSTRQKRYAKEEVKEESQTEELPSQRSIRGGQRKKEIKSQQTLEDNLDSSLLSKRTRKNSEKEMPKPEEVTEVEKPVEDVMIKLPKRTRKSGKEMMEIKDGDSEGSSESFSSIEAQITKRSTRGGKEQNIVVKEDPVNKTRQRRNVTAENTQVMEDQSKRSVRTRRVSKEDVAEDTTTKNEDIAEQSTSRKTKRTVKANEETGSEQEGLTLDPPQSERSSSRTKNKVLKEDSEKLQENTEEEEKLNKDTIEKEDEELSIQQNASRRGRTRTSPKEEPLVANRKRGKANVELSRKNSDEAKEVEVPSGRRGRPRKQTTTDDSETSAVGRESSTPEPSPSRSNSRQRKSPASSQLEVRTPRRTGRLSTAALASSPYIPQSGATPKVLFTGVVDAAGEEIIRSMGGDIAESVFDCTHLITDRVRRTVKFLCALARGIPIVTLDWIDKCKKNGCFLSHAKFLVEDKEQEKNFNFKLSESLLKAKKGLLFEGYEIHVTPSVKPDPDVMKDIISCSGAIFLPKMPRTFKEKCVIVSCAEDAARCKSVPSRVPITTAEFILTGILRQEVNPGAYLLNTVPEDSAPVPAKRRR